MTLKLSQGKRYIISITIDKKTLTYTCVIDNIDDNFVFFTDKFGKSYAYSLKNIVAFTEIQGDNIEEIQKGWKIKT